MPVNLRSGDCNEQLNKEIRHEQNRKKIANSDWPWRSIAHPLQPRGGSRAWIGIFTSCICSVHFVDGICCKKLRHSSKTFSYSIPPINKKPSKERITPLLGSKAFHLGNQVNFHVESTGFVGFLGRPWSETGNCDNQRKKFPNFFPWKESDNKILFAHDSNLVLSSSKNKLPLIIRNRSLDSNKNFINLRLPMMTTNAIWDFTVSGHNAKYDHCLENKDITNHAAQFFQTSFLHTGHTQHLQLLTL